MKPVNVRPRADKEINELADYIASDSLAAAIRFLDAVQKTFALIGAQPGIGSLRYAHSTIFDDLRARPVLGFENHLVFYIERQFYVDVLRVLHGSRDIPAALFNDVNQDVL